MERIRKFGLQYCDLSTMMWNIKILLRVLSLNIDKQYTKGIPITCYIFTVITTICYTYVYFISMYWFVFVKCPETGEFLAAVIVFSLGITSQIAPAKFVFMFINNNSVKKLVEQCLFCDSMVTPGSRFATNIRKNLRVVKRRAMILWFIIVGNGAVYAIKPLFLPGRHLMDDLLIIYGLEPMFESPNYEIALFVTLLGIIFVTYTTSNMTAFLIIVTGCTEAQMLALSEEVTQLWEDAEDYYIANNSEHDNVNSIALKKRLVNDYIKKQLRIVVRSHTMNINLLRQTEKVFRGAIAVEFMLLIISLIAELLGGLENTYLEIPFAMMQVGTDCLVGQRVMDAGIVFENAVYNSKWENFDNDNMKTVLLMLQNSQKTLTLSAGSISTLTFATLMSMLNSIYSAYTTLRSTMNIK